MKAAEETIKRATSSTYSNGFAKKAFSQTVKDGFAHGAAVGEMAGFGFPGEIIGGSIGALGNAATRIGIEKLPVSARNLFRSFEE